MPDWPLVHRELRRKGVTRSCSGSNTSSVTPRASATPGSASAYRRWQGRLDLVMRQEHHAGEKLFVDFAGMTIPITDPDTGEVWQAQLFVAVLGASSYTYAEALPSQALPHWIGAHVHAFAFFEGCPGHHRARQPPLRRHPPPPLRARTQPDVCGAGGPLRLCGHPGEAGDPESKAQASDCTSSARSGREPWLAARRAAC